MKIVNHRLEGVPFDSAKEIGATIDPKFIVLHYTAGYTAKSAIDTFKSSIIAAHLVVDKDGSVTQMVPFNKRANHAGPSEWMGVNGLNGHSIGIEFVNIGWAKKRNDGKLVDSYGRVVPDDKAAAYIPAKNARIGSETYYWEPYSEAQMNVGVELVKSILASYSIRDIVSHEEIDTRKWKTDPGPAFPMNRFTSQMRGSPNVPSDDPIQGMVGVVSTATLNIRGGAGSSYPVIGVTRAGSRLGIQEFKDGWYRVATELNGVPGSGWVSAQFVKVD